MREFALPDFPWDRLTWLSAPPSGGELPDGIPALDPVGERRAVALGHSGPADAAGAMAALDAGIALVRSGVADALVTAPVSKESIARQHLPGFVGHTDYLAEVCGLERYGRDYLMAFLAPGLQVALLNVHLPLRDALDGITPQALAEALDCLGRHAGGKIALLDLQIVMLAEAVRHDRAAMPAAQHLEAAVAFVRIHQRNPAGQDQGLITVRLEIAGILMPGHDARAILGQFRAQAGRSR